MTDTTAMTLRYLHTFIDVEPEPVECGLRRSRSHPYLGYPTTLESTEESMVDGGPCWTTGVFARKPRKRDCGGVRKPWIFMLSKEV